MDPASFGEPGFHRCVIRDIKHERSALPRPHGLDLRNHAIDTFLRHVGDTDGRAARGEAESAIVRPMPRPAPVTRTRRPVRLGRWAMSTGFTSLTDISNSQVSLTHVIVIQQSLCLVGQHHFAIFEDVAAVSGLQV